MSKIFDLDSPVMRFLTKVADLMILNILTLICCIPIITAGAAFTALHYVLLKMVRNEDGYIVKSFFKSFKQNFRQATIIWLFVLMFIFVFIMDIMVFNFTAIATQLPKGVLIIMLAVVVFVAMVTAYVFPVLSRFDNTVKNTIKNALFMSIFSLPKTILMMAVYVLPVVLVYFVPMGMPFVFMFGFSAPAYVAAMLYRGTFKKFEPEEEPIVDRFETGNGSDGIEK